MSITSSISHYHNYKSIPVIKNPSHLSSRNSQRQEFLKSFVCEMVAEKNFIEHGLSSIDRDRSCQVRALNQIASVKSFPVFLPAVHG